MINNIQNFDIVPETTEDIKYRAKLAKDYKRYIKSLTKEQKHFIKTKLANIYWRLNNLYTIRDKWSKLKILRFNLAQNIVHSSKHNKKIILKSRQQGISTYYVEKNLDNCIFQSGISAGIQSYGLDESNKLKMRAELMWEYFPIELKKLLNIELIANNQKGMLFSNGSILKIGNFRGDTLQKLHISELAKIARMYPDRATELKTGAFQAIAIDNEISIESTAEAPQGLFYDIWQRSYRKKQLGQKLTPLDFDAIFLSWINDPDCSLKIKKKDRPQLNQDTIDYIDMLKTEYNITLKQQQIDWLNLKLEELGDDFNKEYPATPELAFKQSLDGTYFLKQYKLLLKDKRIKPITYNFSYPVYVSFDLGINDEMVMLFVQVIDKKPFLIDEYHNTGEGFEHYVRILHSLSETKGYRYASIFMPHDMNVKELGTGLTRLETIRAMGVTNVRVLPKLSFADSINVARTFINSLVINDKCENTILAIQNYKKKWDKKLQIYLDTDVHDIHSNYSASLRYMGQGLGYNKISNSNYHNRARNKYLKKNKNKKFGKYDFSVSKYTKNTKNNTSFSVS